MLDQRPPVDFEAEGFDEHTYVHNDHSHPWEDELLRISGDRNGMGLNETMMSDKMKYSLAFYRKTTSVDDMYVQL